MQYSQQKLAMAVWMWTLCSSKKKNRYENTVPINNSFFHFGCQYENCKNLSEGYWERNTKSENEFESGNISEAFRLSEEAIVLNSEKFYCLFK
ncbi:MAG: hypothetical protein R2788_09845 [Saprospiraceae bacterium]